MFSIGLFEDEEEYQSLWLTPGKYFLIRHWKQLNMVFFEETFNIHLLYLISTSDLCELGRLRQQELR